MSRQSIEHLVVVDDNQPWGRYSAESLLPQFGDLLANVVILDLGSRDGTVADFAKVLSESGQIDLSVRSSDRVEWPNEVLKLFRASTADFVSIQSANLLWSSVRTLAQQVELINESGAGYSWHPILVRNEESIGVFPTPSSSDWNADHPAWTSLPWQSLVLASGCVVNLKVESDSVALTEIRHALTRSSRGIFLRDVASILQNSAGRGRRHQSLRDLRLRMNSEAERSGRTVDVSREWKSLIDSGVVVVKDIEDAMN